MSTYDDDDELWAHHRTIKVAIGLQSVEGSNQRVRHACMGMGAIRRAGHAVCAGLWSKNIVKVAARHQEPDDVGVAGSRGVVNCLQPGHRTSDRKQKHRSAYPKYRLRERVCACDRRERRERREKRERREREKREREEREERERRERFDLFKRQHAAILSNSVQFVLIAARPSPPSNLTRPRSTTPRGERGGE